MACRGKGTISISHTGGFGKSNLKLEQRRLCNQKRKRVATVRGYPEGLDVSTIHLENVFEFVNS